MELRRNRGQIMKSLHMANRGKQQLISLQKKLFDHKFRHTAAVKLAEEAQKETPENICMNTKSSKRDNNKRYFYGI
jgi:hypothetical protein